MSSPEEKEKFGSRRQKTDRYIKRQVKIRNFNGLGQVESHRFHKKSGLTCGNSNCVMCGNPRKFFNEKTMQEKKFLDNQKITNEGVEDGIL